MKISVRSGSHTGQATQLGPFLTGPKAFRKVIFCCFRIWFLLRVSDSQAAPSGMRKCPQGLIFSLGAWFWSSFVDFPGVESIDLHEKHINYETSFKIWSRGATGGKLISSMSSTTSVLTFFASCFSLFLIVSRALENIFGMGARRVQGWAPSGARADHWELPKAPPMAFQNCFCLRSHIFFASIFSHVIFWYTKTYCCSSHIDECMYFCDTQYNFTRQLYKKEQSLLLRLPKLFWCLRDFLDSSRCRKLIKLGKKIHIKQLENSQLGRAPGALYFYI